MASPAHPSQRLVSGAFWSGIGTGASQLFTLLAFILVARSLDRAQFGAVGLLQTTVATFGMLGAAGMGLLAIRYVAELREADPARAGRVLGLATLTAYGLALLLGAAIWLTADWFARAVLSEPALAGELRVASLAMVFAAVAAVQGGALVGFEAFRALARINVVRGALTLIALPAGALAGGVAGVMVALAAVGAATVVLGEITIAVERRRHRVPLALVAGLAEWRLLATFGLPSYLTGLVYPAVLWGLGALIVREPGGYLAMAVFAAAAQWRLAVAFLPQLLSQPALTVLAHITGRGDRYTFVRVYGQSLGLTTAAALVPALLVVVLSRPILSAYGSGYAQGAPVLALLALAVALNAPALIMGSALASRGRMWTVALLNALWAGVVFAAWQLTPGVEPALRAALALTIAHVVHLAASQLAVQAVKRDVHAAAAVPLVPTAPPPAPRRDNTCAVVVTYHPDEAVAQRLEAMRALAAELVIVDNGSEAGALERLRRFAATHPGTTLIENGRNRGVARALNQGAELAAARNYEWFLTFDQDTVPQDDLVAGLAEAFAEHPERARLAMVGARFDDSRCAGAGDGAAWCDVPFVITSGCITATAAWRALGPFADELFIDYVDIEYGMRARAAGYVVAATARRLMQHSVGHATPHQLFGWRTGTSNHSPGRHYTGTRNALIVARRYLATEPGLVLRLLVGRVKVTLLVCLFERDRGAKLRAVLRGLREGLRPSAATH